MPAQAAPHEAPAPTKSKPTPSTGHATPAQCQATTTPANTPYNTSSKQSRASDKQVAGQSRLSADNGFRPEQSQTAQVHVVTKLRMPT